MLVPRPVEESPSSRTSASPVLTTQPFGVYPTKNHNEHIQCATITMTKTSCVMLMTNFEAGYATRACGVCIVRDTLVLKTYSFVTQDKNQLRHANYKFWGQICHTRLWSMAHSWHNSIEEILIRDSCKWGLSQSKLRIKLYLSRNWDWDFVSRVYRLWCSTWDTW